MLLNEEQLEIAAKKLCELRNLDPKNIPILELVQFYTLGVAVPERKPLTNLHFAKEQIRQVNQLQEAITFGYESSFGSAHKR